MIDQELEHFDVRALTGHELAEQVRHAKYMLVAAAAGSFAILGVSALVVSLWM